MAVFRIVQEMLSNVGRHAHARHLAVHITCTATALRVSVQDDGVGAPAQALEAGNAYGILGMRERAPSGTSVARSASSAPLDRAPQPS